VGRKDAFCAAFHALPVILKSSVGIQSTELTLLNSVAVLFVDAFAQVSTQPGVDITATTSVIWRQGSC
jgi:hypothetical protein